MGEQYKSPPQAEGTMIRIRAADAIISTQSEKFMKIPVLYIKPEVHHVSIFHTVFFSFNSQFAGFAA